MNYLNSVRWMLKKIPFYQNDGLKSFNPGLKRIKKFCKYLGNPQEFFKSVHIGGTNGKGSTIYMLRSIFQEEKYKVGSFISPHLLDFRERILFNESYIEKNFVIDFLKDNKKIIENEEMSFFEINTALSFQYFKDKKVDIAFIEVGMGGRLDSTNIIIPELSAITNISIDHTNVLGKNCFEIAFEKAGIIKNNIPIVIGNNIKRNIRHFFFQKALEKNSPIYFSKENELINKYYTKFDVYYQNLNKSLVIEIVNVLKKRKNIFVSDKSIENGLKKMNNNINFKGRWHILKKNSPKIICDVAHNKDGIRMINIQLKKEFYKKLHLVLGFVKEKNIENFLNFFPDESYYYFCQPNIDRKYPIKLLRKKVEIFLKKKKNVIKYFDTVKSAFYEAKRNALKNDLILISGSTFVVSDIFLI